MNKETEFKLDDLSLNGMSLADTKKEKRKLFIRWIGSILLTNILIYQMTRHEVINDPIEKNIWKTPNNFKRIKLPLHIFVDLSLVEEGIPTKVALYTHNYKKIIKSVYLIPRQLNENKNDFNAEDLGGQVYSIDVHQDDAEKLIPYLNKKIFAYPTTTHKPQKKISTTRRINYEVVF